MLLKDHSITHGGVTFAPDPKLGGATTRGQSAIRYVRFGRIADLEKIELPPNACARWVPGLPCHPDHVMVQTLDAATGKWNTIRDLHLKPDPRVWGEGLPADATEEQRDAFFAATISAPPHVIDLKGVRTDHLRLVCDREHETYPNHGECNGGPLNVPYGVFDRVQVHGSVAGEVKTPDYLPHLRQLDINPEAPRGMKLVRKPGMILFEGKKFTVGFSLARPMLINLGWDAFRRGKPVNRISDTRRGSNAVGLCGPHLRTLTTDAPSHGWTGTVSIQGSRIAYRDLDCGLGVKIDAIFDVTPDGLKLEITTTAERDIPVIEFEAWRLLFQIRDRMTGAAAVPTQVEGRNGQVKLPMMWGADGAGALSFRMIEGPPESYVQVESYRNAGGFTGTTAFISGGVVMSPRSGPEACEVIPQGVRRGVFEWRVTAFDPNSKLAKSAAPGIRMQWGSIYSCFRPELAGFSNHAASVNCHVNQQSVLELVASTRRPSPRLGPDPMDLLRFTIERGLMNGRGYGYFRSLYLDSDPVLICGEGRIHQTKPDLKFLRRVEPGLRTAVERMLGTFGEEGLSICRELSGDSGSFRWSSNAMDVVGFGHMDAYVNAYTYRALRNAAPLLADLGNHDLAKRCRDAADALLPAYAKYLLNPETGWVAGWRSRDGRLHDYAFTFINGPALAFGLLAPPLARKALENLEALRKRVGADTAYHGLACNLLPIRYEDHMLPRIRNALLSTFESYTDGSMMPSCASYYLRALSIHGLHDSAAKMASELNESFAAGHFCGGTDSGIEFRCWDGLASGYEGTFPPSFSVLYGIAIAQGLIQPPTPEWWPADG